MNILKNLKTIKILGVMTGTSCDGLDAACMEFNSTGWNPLWTATHPYPSSLKARVLAFQKGGSLTSQEILELHRALGNWYGRTLQKLIRKHSTAKAFPDVIALHGQTVAHFPKPRTRMTWQMGDSSCVAHWTGITVVSDFRSGDLAAGGQGAPLVPVFHSLIAKALDPDPQGIAIHNIGGISNLTYIGPKGEILAFDTGPGNIWIDGAVEWISQGKLKFDRNGNLARQGQPDHQAVRTLISKHPYFKKNIPKSTGRDELPFSYFLSLVKNKKRTLKNQDLVSTATAMTVESISDAYKRFVLKSGLPLKKIFICGGGAKNLTLLQELRSKLPEIQIVNMSKAGMDAQAIEAQAFAYLGYRSLLGLPLGGSWTGARGFGPPGHWTPGENWGSVILKAQQILAAQPGTLVSDPIG